MAHPLERPVPENPVRPEQPRGELAARALAMPPHANPMGTNRDQAGARSGGGHRGRLPIAFLQPVRVGDAVCRYTDVVRVGISSITLAIEVWVLRQGQGPRAMVTDAEFTVVAVDEAGKPRPLESAPDETVAERHPYPRLRA